MTNVEITTIPTANLIDLMREVIREEFAKIEESKPKPIKLHTSDQVCKILAISESTYRRYVKDGTLKASKIRGRIVIKDEDLQDALKGIKTLKYRRV